MTSFLIASAPEPASDDGERGFFERRLAEEKAALEAAADEAAGSHHRRLVARYEAVLRLYEGAETA